MIYRDLIFFKINVNWDEILSMVGPIVILNFYELDISVVSWLSNYQKYLKIALCPKVAEYSTFEDCARTSYVRTENM